MPWEHEHVHTDTCIQRHTIQCEYIFFFVSIANAENSHKFTLTVYIDALSSEFKKIK